VPLASGLQVLSRQECLDLLDTAQIGRIVFTDRALPAVKPVNFCLYGEHIVIRTSAGSKLAAATQRTVVAFEADDFDPDSRTGRSVTMVGHARALCREARSRLPRLACLMLTSYADDDALFEAVMAGAAGYVLKQIHGSDLVGAVRTVASGQSLLDPQTTAAMLQRLREQAAKRDPLAALSDQERNILDLIGEGLTNRQIGERMFLAEKTVKNYVSNLLSKLDMQRRTQAAALSARLRTDRRD
jgi:DNA-binding NarL/FixJ family response regulator